MIGYPSAFTYAYSENTNTSSIKGIIDKVVSDTLDGMMNDTINSLVQDTSKSVLSHNSKFNQNKFPSSLDMSQIPVSLPYDNSIAINSSGSTLEKNRDYTSEAIASSNNPTTRIDDSNGSNSSNKTQTSVVDSKVNQSGMSDVHNSSSDILNNQKTNDDTKSVDYLADFFHKLKQLFFKGS
jgi:hypothetical protein